MRTSAFLFALFCLSSQINYAQLSTSASTPTNLVQNVLLGAGVTASNITYTGYVNGISEFSAPASGGLGITNGLYLTSGSYLANDPSNIFSFGEDGPMGPSSNFQSVSNGTPGDPYLDTISSSTSYDAAILEFDFVPQSDSVKFRYTFGSEEYNDFVSTGSGGVNDAFAFVLSGVSTPLSPVNLALIPGTSTPVSIFTVNNGYSGGVSSGPCLNCAYYRDNVNGTVDVAYDGLTTVLTASHQVICGETYHIRIMISDAGDAAYDSGVFLEAGSFSSSTPFAVSSSVNGTAGDTMAVEGCDNMQIVFVRPASTIATAASYTIDVTGTATGGTDYTTIPNAISFPIGEDSVVFSFTPVMDGIAEGTETIIITINNVNVCGVVTSLHYNFAISDITPIILTTVSDTICPGLSAELSVAATGGAGSYSYSWNTGSVNDSITVSPSATTIYTVTVDDNCAGTAQVQATATVTAIPTFTLGMPVQPDTYCTNTGSGLVTAVTVPVVPGSWSGVGLTDIGNGQASFVPSALPLGPNVFTYNAGAGGCNSSVQYTVTIHQYTDPAFTPVSPKCAYDAPVNFAAANAGGQWFINSVAFGGTADPATLGAGTYQIKYVTGIPACPDSATHPFIVNPKPEVVFTTDTTEGCLIGGNVYSFAPQLTAGIGNGSFQWYFGDGSSGSTLATPVHMYSGAGSYTIKLIYTDPNGCLDDTTAVSYITVHPHPSADFYFSNENPTILEPQVDMLNTTDPSGNTFYWNIPGLLSSTEYNTGLIFPQAGTYPVTLAATNQYNCSDSITRLLKVLNEEVIYIPNSFTPNNDGKNDYFFAKGFGFNEKEGFKMQIFNRWGERIFETGDPATYWNGSKNNHSTSSAIEDTYIYVVNYKDLEGKKYTRTGQVTVMR
ncbi:MAG: hypothetical protein K0S33_100 [Bacteroidetes bacterium]|jgi:gliding motility-associated-like protein|nr:hypothetical protein [Bacteroidota bacterium]